MTQATTHPMPTPEDLAALAARPLGEIARLARQVNAANGWGLTFRYDDVPGYLALIHSEIVEADRELAPAPRNRELGDVLVRAMDLAELLSPGALEREGWDPGDVLTSPLARRLLELHGHAADALEAYRKKDEATARQELLDHLRVLILDTHDLITEYGGQPREIVVDILVANAQRGYRHGGRRT